MKMLPSKSRIISPCIISVAMATRLAGMLTMADCHTSNTWSTIYRDGDGPPLQVRRHWGGGRTEGSRRSGTSRRGLYRRGGSDGTGIGNNLSAIYDDDDERDVENNNDGTNTNNATTAISSALSSLAGGRPLLYSACSAQGERRYMEDEYLVERGRFAAVFDGHGGSAVSRYLRQNLYANFQAALPSSASTAMGTYNAGDREVRMQQPPQNVQSSIVASALEAALDKVDSEVGNISHWSFQGSTALAVSIHENIADGTRSIVSANVGDSRAVLSRSGTALDLTRDHKPNDVMERGRIEALGGSVDWCGDVDGRGRPVEHTGVYRINGNLALSRAIGDRSERPWVTNSVDLAHYRIDEENDSFVVLATDGLYDVMSSQDVVSFVHGIMDDRPPGQRHELRRDIAKHVVDEALKRGTNDNITVLVIWIDQES